MSNDLEAQAARISADIEYAVKKQLNIGLDKASDRLVQGLEQNSPSNPKTTKNKYKNSWKVNRKYKNVRYVGNTKTVKGERGNIPLSNLLEVGESKQPHIRSTYDKMEDELADIVINELNKIF